MFTDLMNIVAQIWLPYTVRKETAAFGYFRQSITSGLRVKGDESCDCLLFWKQETPDS